MNTTRAACLEFEMLDGIGHVSACSVNTGIGERFVKHLSGGTDEGVTRHIFLIAGLFADEHQRGVDGPLTEHHLRGGLPQRTAGAADGFAAQCVPCGGTALPCRAAFDHS